MHDPASVLDPRHSSQRLRGWVRRLGLAALMALASFSVVADAAPETWRFDPAHTQIWFGSDHQGFSHPLGRLRIKSGWFQFDEKDWSTARVDVVIDMASADMGDPKWNEAIKAGAFLDTDRWPTARFFSRNVEKRDDGNGVIHGELQFRGRNVPFDVAFHFNRIGTDPYLFKRKVGFSASASLSRSAFGMKRYAEVVGDTIDLRFEVEGIRDDNAATTFTPGE